MSEMKQALDTAWPKIQVYCKEHYAGRSIRDVQVSWYFDTYHWLEFGVTADGDPYFVRGDHSKSSRSNNADWYYHPTHAEGYFGTKYGSMERIVRDWPVIKEKLEKAFQKEEQILNFQP